MSSANSTASLGSAQAAQRPQAMAYRPSPTRAATFAIPYSKARAASQPPGERLSGPSSNPDSGRGSPASPYGPIGNARPTARSGPGHANAPGTQTRSNSFSVAELGLREPRSSSVGQALTAHLEEHPSRSSSESPYPTFSPASSPSTSPATHFKPSLPGSRSPPKAEATASRSRSQSLATGPRPIVPDRPYLAPMSALDQSSAFHRDPQAWHDDHVGNMSPFTRSFAHMGSGGEGGYKGGGPHSQLSSSVAHALGSHNQPSYSTVVGGFDPSGSKSGTSSRRHSVTVVGGGPGGRHFMYGDGFTSPPGRGLGQLGFTDEELLPEKLESALSLEIRESRKQGVEIEQRTPWGRAESAKEIRIPPKRTQTLGGEMIYGSSPGARGQSDLGSSAEAREPSRDSSESRRAVGSPAVGTSFGKPSGLSAQPINTPNQGRDPGPMGPIGARGPGPIGSPTAYDDRFGPGPGFGAVPMPNMGFRPYGGAPPMRPAPIPGPGQGYFPPSGRTPYGGPAGGAGGYGGPSIASGMGYGGGAGYGGPSPPPPTSPSSFSTLTLSELGKGLPLNSLSPSTALYIVAFKAGRRDVFYCPDPTLLISVGDRVIVEADRGSDLGTVVYDQLTPVDVREWQEKQATAALMSGASQHQPPGMAQQPTIAPSKPRVSASVGGELAGADLATLLGGVGPSGQPDMVGTQARGPLAKEIMPKRIFAKSAQGPEEQARMMEKAKDEYDAMMICREKVVQRGLPMQIVDAEYQWDRRKLTFYFKADKRVDFRDLTKENFRIFKSRIWMSMVGRDEILGEGCDHEEDGGGSNDPD